MRRLSSAFLSVLSVLSVGLLGFGLAEEAPEVVPTLERSFEGPATPMAPMAPEDLPAATGMRFGIDANSIDRFAEQAGTPDYATVWVGKWNLDYGWRDTTAALQSIQAQGATPAIHFYYWGDDMSRACLWEGCNGKNQQGWQMLAQDLATHLNSDLQGTPVLIILESEFNKDGVHLDEGLDQMLAEKAMYLKASYPTAQVVLGLGNWYPSAWATWDRAAAASDYVGLQALAGSTHESPDEVVELADATLEGVRTVRSLFGKPVIVQDVAISSYPEPDHLETQAEAVARFAQSLPQLRQEGVEAVLYRAYLDAPNMNLANHYAEAERHWGLAWHDTGELKPAGATWLAAIVKAREPPPAPADLAAANGTAPNGS
ncbi:MAG: hypothetical protein ACYC2H_09690 [Thermoplasmatota archaeon]